MVVVNPERLRGSERRHGHVEVRPLRLHQGKISELAQPLGMPFGLLGSLGLLVKVADDLAQEVGLRHEAAPARARTGIQAGAASIHWELGAHTRKFFLFGKDCGVGERRIAALVTDDEQIAQPFDAPHEHEKGEERIYCIGHRTESVA